METTPSVKPPLTDEQRLQYLVAGISDYAIYMLDPQGYVNSWNAGAQRFKGYLEAEILNQHFSRFYTPEDRDAGLPALALAEALAQGRFESEGWRVRKDGGQFWAHVVIDPIHDDSGTLLGFAKITRDITEKKKAEDLLRESEQRFRLLVQGVSDYAIYMLSPEGIVSNWNSGAESIKGYAADEIVGQHFSRFYTDEDRVGGLPARALANAGAVGRYEAEGWRVRKDGTRFWANVVIDAIRDGDGNLLGFAKVTRDLTEKQAAAEALDKAQAALFQAQKMESIGQLTGGIAHDFNNLLSVISSGVELLSMQRNPGGDAKTLDSMRRAIDRGATLTGQLLAFARQQPLEPETRNINRIINGFESVLRRAANTSIEFVLELDPLAHNAVIDAARFSTARVGRAEPGGQCARRHAGWRADQGGHRQCAPGPRRPVGPGARRVRAPVRERHRHRHDAGDHCARLRAILHDQGDRQGHGPGTVASVWVHQAVGRRGDDRQHAGGGHEHRDLAAGRGRQRA
jgi:PAS domain S-box-containing protein